MCKLCDAAKGDAYRQLIEKMTQEDSARIEFTKERAKEMQLLAKRCYSSINWPIKLYYPMFEARMAYAIPANYFQPLLLDDEKIGSAFGHGAMRSVFFAGERLMLFTKTTNFLDGKEYFTSFLLLHLEKNEYSLKVDGENFAISADVTKPMRNLVTGAAENKKVKFNFVNTQVKGRIVTKEKVLTSAQFKDIYAKYGGGVRGRTASVDLEGYAITVPHFAPHPFLLQLKEQFGYASNREFQEHVFDYFAAHR
ncbi:MAG: hypothetical protein V1492_05535 [Candidatus Micrarchaeota archaeon]